MTHTIIFEAEKYTPATMSYIYRTQDISFEHSEKVNGKEYVLNIEASIKYKACYDSECNYHDFELVSYNTNYKEISEHNDLQFNIIFI